MTPKIISYDVEIKSTSKLWVQKVPEVYTNDSNSVDIQFNLIDCTEAELLNSTAQVLLYMQDGSFFQNMGVDVVRTGTTFSYTLKDNEGNHQGLTETQLVLTIPGTPDDVYASQMYQFKIKNGLGNKVQVETFIQTWETLTTEANAFIAQMETDVQEFDVALESGVLATNIAAKLTDLETTYAPDLLSVKQQLEHKDDESNRVTSAWDTFNRADSAITTSEDGQTYLVAGDSAEQLFKIVNKKAVLGTSLGNAYLSLDAGSTIETIGAEWVWETGTTTATVAVVITNDQTLALGNLLHWITNSNSWYLQLRKGGSGNELITVMTGNYKTPLQKDGLTKYRFEMTVAKDKNTVYMRLPDGDIAVYKHADVALVTGSRGYWQIIRRNATDEEPKFNSFWLTKKDETIRYRSGKENLDIYPAIVKAKEYTQDNGVLKKLYSFTPTQSGWYRIISGVLDVLVGSVRMYTDGQYDSSITDNEIEFNVSAFSSSSPVISQIKHSTFNNGIVTQVRVGNNGSNALYLDIYIKSATAPVPIYFEFSGFSLLKSLSSGAQTLFNPTASPATPTNSATLILGKGLRTTNIIASKATENEVEIVTATANVNTNISVTAIDSTSGAVTLTLPTSTGVTNHVHTFSKLDGSANASTVVGYFSDGTTSKALTRGVPLKVVADGTSNRWILI